MEDVETLTEREAIDGELAALEIPPEAAAIVQQADKIIAAHENKIANLRARRDAIDERFQVSAHQAADDREQQRQQRFAELASGILNAHDDWLAISLSATASRSVIHPLILTMGILTVSLTRDC